MRKFSVCQSLGLLSDTKIEMMFLVALRNIYVALFGSYVRIESSTGSH